MMLLGSLVKQLEAKRTDDVPDSKFSRERTPRTIEKPSLQVNEPVVAKKVINSHPPSDIDETRFIKPPPETAPVGDINTSLPPRGCRDDNFLQRLYYEDNQPEESRRVSVIRGDKVHSTMLPDICPRQVSLMRDYKMSPCDRLPRCNDRLVWATGKAFEKHIRQQLIKSVGLNDVWGGSTSCRCGQLSIPLLIQEERLIEHCVHCKTHSNHTYHEAELELEEEHCTSASDFGTWNTKAELVITEIKSKKLEPFLAMNIPEALNVRQAVFYNQVAKKLGYPTADYVMIIYASKGFVKYEDGLPYKVYKVNLSEVPSMIKGSESLFETGRLLKEVIEKGVIPDRRCSDPSLTAAKNCEVCALCFSLDSPPS